MNIGFCKHILMIRSVFQDVLCCSISNNSSEVNVLFYVWHHFLLYDIFVKSAAKTCLLGSTYWRPPAYSIVLQIILTNAMYSGLIWGTKACQNHDLLAPYTYQKQRSRPQDQHGFDGTHIEPVLKTCDSL